MSDVRMSLVIPCYNERANLPALLGRLSELPFEQENCEVVLVDNGSSDDTPEYLANALAPGGAVRSVRVEHNQGYGFGILSGLREARGRVLAWTHADLQTDPGDALKGLSHFRFARNPEQLFVKGRRTGRPLGDVVFTAGMSVFETLLMHRQMWDINAQPTMFPRSFFELWEDDAPHDFSLDLYAYYTALNAGYQVERFTVRFGDRLHGHSHWNVDWRSKLKFIRRTLSYSLELRKHLSET